MEWHRGVSPCGSAPLSRKNVSQHLRNGALSFPIISLGPPLSSTFSTPCAGSGGRQIDCENAGFRPYPLDPFANASQWGISPVENKWFPPLLLKEAKITIR